MKLNQLQMLRELRKILVRPDTSVVIRRLTGKYAHSRFFIWNEEPREIKDIRIFIDPRQDSHVTLIIHELLHIYLAQYFMIDQKLNDRLEEDVVLALEARLFDYLRDPKNVKLLESWDKAIKRKLG